MSDLNILIVEGNIREDSEFFIKAAGASAADNFKNLILKLEPSTNTEIINPGHDDETENVLKNMSKYDGIVFTGGAMRINDMNDVIKKHINFASSCFAEKKKILAICWGLQVCSTAAGGKVNPELIRIDILSKTYGDPLLTKIRQYFNKKNKLSKVKVKFKIPTVFSSETSIKPEKTNLNESLTGLNCAGYGSSVNVTATFAFLTSSYVLSNL